ncbi:MFS transporter [Kitasatospora sp. DSM 101779]|uniref:MFS transporter n=1 Tax=Kitasatospora sp. DSM 101779 TaxID=2853165 RepID=UPI0021D8ED00|nr:MFS transporter [Kitasatospora sp. DSM 101779]MCU7821294.1 MFS transporter [Kitasatospora sp. DSM 101779]
MSGNAPPPLRRSTLFAMCACVLVAQSMVAAINLMIPQLAASALHPSPGALLWTVDAYVIVFAGLLIPAGACGDRWGRRRALLAGLALFAGGACLSAAGGPLGSVAALIAGRAVSGAGAALVMPATMAVLVHLAGPERRVQALASWTLAVGLGGLAGNVGGGLTAQYLPWQALFWAMVPLSALLAAAVLRTVPELPRHAATPDPAGSALLIAGTAAVLYGIIEGPSHGWFSVPVLAGFAAGAALLATFTWYGLAARRPLVDPRVFRSRRLRAAVLGTAASFFGLFALFFVNSQFLQYAKGYSPARTGFAIVPLTVGMALVPRFAGRLQARHGVRWVAGGGLALIGAGLLGVSTAGPDTPYPLYALWLLLLSAGMGLSAPGLTHAVVSELPPAQAGLGAGLNTAARELGAALGVAVVGTVLASRAGGAGHGPAEFTAGMATGLRVVAVPVLLAAVAVLAGLRDRPAADRPAPAPEPAAETA